MVSDGRASILVVDDNPLIVNVLTSLLSSQDYDVYSSANGKEASDLLEHHSVDVIVCDVMMPEMDGYAFHDYVRSKAELSHIPFVFLTALGSSGELNHGRESGADDYLVKPFNPQDLLSIVKGKVIRSKRLKALSEERYESFRKRVIHTLSHEFRTPLVAINTGTELLLENKEKFEEVSEHATKLITAIQHGGQRLEKLVTDFMLLQQLEAGVAQRLYESRAQNYTAKELMDDLHSSNELELLKAGVQFSTVVQAPDAQIKIFEPQILDALGRLINNSIKFSQDIKEIEGVSYTKNDKVYFEIRDRGIGIDPSQIQEALAVFGQIDRDTMEQQGGGMGLAIAARYVKINNGSLEFHKRDGGGSIVAVVLPLIV